jgi:NAD(P)-dependent dehydrogenase (short-subunit alcohol dehydrogenase family)
MEPAQAGNDNRPGLRDRVVGALMWAGDCRAGPSRRCENGVASHESEDRMSKDDGRDAETGRLAGKVAIITGGTSGIGAATARRFVEEDARVVIAGRSRDKGEALAAELGSGAIYQETDVTRESDLAAMVDRAVGEFGRLDCLFNNAGAATPGSLESVSQEQFDQAMQLLLASAIFAIKYAIPVMKVQGGGSIINNSSIAALRINQAHILYGVAKAGLTHLSYLAGSELGPIGIRVNSISPGAIATPIFWGGSQVAQDLSDEVNAEKQAKLEKNLAHATPLPRSGLPLDIANAALFLASDEGSFVNCQDLVVDGGRISMFYEKPISARS